MLACGAAALLCGSVLVGALPRGFQRGVCLEGGPPLSAEHVEQLAALGATHVSLNPFGWLEAPDVPHVRMATARPASSSRWWGESDAGLRQYAALAHARGLTVMLRPHLWLRSTSTRSGRTGLWLGDVDFATPEEWRTFFDGYRKLALHYARLAEDSGIAWYSVGAELTRATLQHPDEWRRLVAEVRAVYRGKLLYSANWHAEVEGIEFWDALDAIGVQAYYPIAASAEATEDEMLEGWRPHLRALERVSARFGRPVVFTEVGYKASAEGAVRPWEWSGDGPVREDVQARAYRATFRALAGAPHVTGMYWWKYHVAPPRELRGTQARADAQAGYSWQGRPAEQVLRAAYAAEAAP